jgi:ABC-2 type transport system permease protein
MPAHHCASQAICSRRQSYPLAARLVSYAIPTAYGLDIMRGLLLGTKTLLPIPFEFLVLCGFTLLSPLLSIIIYRKLEKSIMKKEGIGGY